MKEMKDLSVEEKKAFGQKVNELKAEVADAIAARTTELNELEVLKEIESMPEFDVSMPANRLFVLVQKSCDLPLRLAAPFPGRCRNIFAGEYCSRKPKTEI